VARESLCGFDGVPLKNLGEAVSRHRADVGEGFGMRDRAATHQIRYRPTTSKSGRGAAKKSKKPPRKARIWACKLGHS
jgi:hypothetical protein